MKVNLIPALAGFGTLCMYCGVLLVCGTLFLLVFQTYSWLRFGVWPPFALASVCIWIDWYPQYTHWVGVDRMIASILDWSLSLTSFIAGVALLISGATLGGNIDT